MLECIFPKPCFSAAGGTAIDNLRMDMEKGYDIPISLCHQNSSPNFKEILGSYPNLLGNKTSETEDFNIAAAYLIPFGRFTSAEDGQLLPVKRPFVLAQGHPTFQIFCSYIHLVGHTFYQILEPRCPPTGSQSAFPTDNPCHHC